MDRDEAARLLGVSPDTIDRWVRQGLLRADGHRFAREELERWARRTGIRMGALQQAAAPVDEDLLAGAVRRGAVTVEAPARTALEAIEQAVEALGDLSAEARAELLLAATDRERMASTALGDGVAIPHPRKPQATLVDAPRVSVLFPVEPLDWAALDDQPVHTVLLLVSPSAPVHLELLSRVAFALRTPGFADFLKQAPAPETLIDELQRIRRDG